MEDILDGSIIKFKEKQVLPTKGLREENNLPRSQSIANTDSITKKSRPLCTLKPQAKKTKVVQHFEGFLDSGAQSEKSASAPVSPGNRSPEEGSQHVDGELSLDEIEIPVEARDQAPARDVEVSANEDPIKIIDNNSHCVFSSGLDKSNQQMVGPEDELHDSSSESTPKS